jgi:hypothetical protein
MLEDQILLAKLSVMQQIVAMPNQWNECSTIQPMAISSTAYFLLQENIRRNARISIARRGNDW